MPQPFLVGLIGAGIGPSLTPALHMAEAKALGLDYLYRTIDLADLGIEPSEIGDLVRSARTLGFDALNITHPCKQLVVEHLDALDDRAARLGAVNTVIFDDRGAVGHNTDASGFATAFRTGLPDAAVTEVVQLGAGGAGAAVADALLTHGVEHLTVVDLNAGRATELARALAARFPTARVDADGIDELAVLVPHSDGLVHCTPTGMADHPGTALDPALLHPALWVADVVYRPLSTALLQAARRAGCRTLSGGRMAVHQAADTFTLVTGVRPDLDRMFTSFSSLLGGEAR
ncbi:MAG TPA: shikimate dehydrogenase [Microlunatus sp.]|jgi:shikimate dehydrogenase|nr:shikimate dehydrogenase [Microlunatus sp.]